MQAVKPGLGEFVDFERRLVAGLGTWHSFNHRVAAEFAGDDDKRAVELFPRPVVAAYDDMHRWLDQELPVNGPSRTSNGSATFCTNSSHQSGWPDRSPGSCGSRIGA